MRVLSIILLFAAAFSTVGAQTLPARLDSVGRPAELTMHWRVRPLVAEACAWGLVWNVASDSCYDGAEITLHDARYDDALGREAAELCVYSVRGGEVVDRQVSRFAPSASMRKGGGSLRLSLARGASQAVLEAGYGKPEVSVPVSLGDGGRVGRYVLCKADTLRDELRVVRLPEPEAPPFGNAGELRAYLARTADVNECEWVYYDRDTDPARLSGGSDYRLATIADGRHGYTILLVDASGRLSVKGRLRPTGFIGQYDLYWLDAAGEPMGAECSALLTDGSLLTLRFPLYAGSVRYRRAVTTD